MPDRLTTPGPVRGNPCVKEAVCVHTRKVYDSCRDKECIQDMRVYLTSASRRCLKAPPASGPGSAQLIWVYVDVDSVPFNKGFLHRGRGILLPHHGRGFYTGVGKPTIIEGVSSYSKRVILYGSEGAMRTFVSDL